MCVINIHIEVPSDQMHLYISSFQYYDSYDSSLSGKSCRNVYFVWCCRKTQSVLFCFTQVSTLLMIVRNRSSKTWTLASIWTLGVSAQQTHKTDRSIFLFLRFSSVLFPTSMFLTHFSLYRRTQRCGEEYSAAAADWKTNSCENRHLKAALKQSVTLLCSPEDLFVCFITD